MTVLDKEKELLRMQEELEERRLVIAKKQQVRENMSTDIEAYKVAQLHIAQREGINQQTLVEAIMAKIGKPAEGTKIVNFVGSASNGDVGSASGAGGATSMLHQLAPQVLMMKEILGQVGAIDPRAAGDGPTTFAPK